MQTGDAEIELDNDGRRRSRGIRQTYRFAVIDCMLCKKQTQIGGNEAPGSWVLMGAHALVTASYRQIVVIQS